MSTEVSRQIRKYDQNNILSGCKYAEKNADNLDKFGVETIK